MATRSPLSLLEADVLDALWKLQEGTAAELGVALRRDPPLKDSTVRTVLTRLEEKGYVRHRVLGRTYHYKGVDEPRSLAVRAVRQIVDRFCRGSVESLLTGLVTEEVLTPKELVRIAARLAEAAPEKTKRSLKKTDGGLK